MSQHKFWPALAVSATVLLAGGSLAQGGGMPGGGPSTGALPQPTDTAPPSEPAQRVDPSAGDSMSGVGGGDAKTASTLKKHGKKKAKAKTPKPADNDNNATPNTVKPDSSAQ
jgi:hypothetical protein